MQVVFTRYRSLLGPGQYKHTDWGLPVDQTVPRGIDAMAGSMKNALKTDERRFSNGKIMGAH